MKQLTFEQLTAGIKDRNLAEENSRLVEKWSRTGLLKGLDGDRKENMARLLENQAAEVLRETSSLSTGLAAGSSSGKLQGFTAIAFPVVRRVFGSLIANELVSIQPMALPSGLIFYLDYTYGNNVGGDEDSGLSVTATNRTYNQADSIYGSPAGAGVRSGSQAIGGMYDLVGAGYSRVQSQSATISGSGMWVGAWTGAGETWAVGGTVNAVGAFTGTNARFANFDPQIEQDLRTNALNFCFVHIRCEMITGSAGLVNADLTAVDQMAITAFNTTNGAIAWGPNYQGGTGVLNLRRANKRGTFNETTQLFTPDPLGGAHIQFVIALSNGGSVPVVSNTSKMSMVVTDTISVDSSSGATLTLPSFESNFGTSPNPAIPEVDIKIQAIALTAETRKLRARWSPELAQDLNAYQSMDAELELTQILSEQIALEVDREIIGDLLTQGNAANLFWSRSPGKFVNKTTGTEIQLNNSLSAGPRFTGTVQEWNTVLVETIIDAANTIYRKTLRGAGNFIVTSPDVCTLLESTLYYRAKYTVDSDGQIGGMMNLAAETVGTLSNRFTVYKDPYFPRNKVLVGYKGRSNLETGYVYSPYVPLIVTPTIYQPDDFTPRRGVMTRYGKKMVRSDFFASVTVLDLNII